MNNDRNQYYAEVLSELIKCETVSVSGKDEPEKFEKFHKILAEKFPKLFNSCEIMNFNGSLLMKWKGKTDNKPIMLMSHHDVVEPLGEWEHEPFSGDIAEGKVWGRGTVDTKGSLWAIMQAAEELISEGFEPERDVYIESACTEETDGRGARSIAEWLKNEGIGFYFTLDEGGMIIYDPIGGAEGTFAMVGVGEKACVDLKFIAESTGGHASTPPKNTPLVRLGKFMAEADEAKLFDIKMNDCTAEMFTRMAPCSKGIKKTLFKNMKKIKSFAGNLLSGTSPTAAALFKTTLAFTMSKGSEGTNVLPGEAYVVGNMRVSHHQGIKSSIESIKKLADKYNLKTEILDPGTESPISDYNSPQFRLIEKTVEEIFDDVSTSPYIMTGASDSRFFGEISDCCLRFAPFKIDEKQLASIHGVNENIDIKALAPAVDFYKRVIEGV